MKLDIGLMTFELPAVAGYARRADELGFGAIWSAETRHDPFLRRCAGWPAKSPTASTCTPSTARGT